MGVDLAKRVELSGTYRDTDAYPAAVVNITNRCNLSCRHCFIFRDANPNEPSSPRSEIPDDELLSILEALRDRHGIAVLLWMGGEPLLRRGLVERGVSLFARNTVVTNGTIPLPDLGPDNLFVVSLDGPHEVNDAIRGHGTFDRVLRNLSRVPDGFSTPIQVQCTVTRTNEEHLDELVEVLAGSRVDWMTFTFYVPPADDTSGIGWPDLTARMRAVDTVMRLKERYPAFVRNRRRALELMAPDVAPAITRACPAQRLVLPLYLEGDRFVTPFCCYGNDVDCDRCGAWIVFAAAAGLEDGGLSSGPEGGAWGQGVSGRAGRRA